MKKRNRQLGPLRQQINDRVDPFFTPRLLRTKRIGPHRFEVLSLLFGRLIGDQHREYRSGSTRITFHQSSKNVEYLHWIHSQLSQYGYCNQIQPQTVTKQTGKHNRVYYSMKFHTWQFQSFNFIRDVWYVENLKVIPDCLEMYLTPLAFQLLLMDDQTRREQGGILIQTHGFDSESCQKLHLMLERKFNLEATARVNSKAQYTIYFAKDQMPRIIELVLPYFCKSMHYKLGMSRTYPAIQLNFMGFPYGEVFCLAKHQALPLSGTTNLTVFCLNLL